MIMRTLMQMRCRLNDKNGDRDENDNEDDDAQLHTWSLIPSSIRLRRLFFSSATFPFGLSILPEMGKINFGTKINKKYDLKHDECCDDNGGGQYCLGGGKHKKLFISSISQAWVLSPRFVYFPMLKVITPRLCFSFLIRKTIQHINNRWHVCQ